MTDDTPVQCCLSVGIYCCALNITFFHIIPTPKSTAGVHTISILQNTSVWNTVTHTPFFPLKSMARNLKYKKDIPTFCFLIVVIVLMNGHQWAICLLSECCIVLDMYLVRCGGLAWLGVWGLSCGCKRWEFCEWGHRRWVRKGSITSRLWRIHLLVALCSSSLLYLLSVSYQMQHLTPSWMLRPRASVMYVHLAYVCLSC